MEPRIKTILLVMFCLNGWVFLSQPAKAQVNLQQGLVAYYPFNGNANDESGNENHGLVYGATLTEDRFGNPNSAYWFDGINHYIEVLNSTSLNPSQEITIQAWYFTASFQGVGNNAIVNKAYYTHTPPYYQYHLGVTGNLYGNSQSSFGFSAGGYNQVSTPDGFWEIGRWYHLVAIYNQQELRLYINGNLINSEPFTGLMVDYGKNLRIAKYSNRVECTPGIIDDIRIYNRALSEQEILALYFENMSYGPISNIQVNQRSDGSGLVDVYFDLDGPQDSYSISVEVSFDGGLNYSVISQEYLTGDLSQIPSGQQKHIVWDGLASHPNLYSPSTKLKIVAN